MDTRIGGSKELGFYGGGFDKVQCGKYRRPRDPVWKSLHLLQKRITKHWYGIVSNL